MSGSLWSRIRFNMAEEFTKNSEKEARSPLFGALDADWTKAIGALFERPKDKLEKKSPDIETTQLRDGQIKYEYPSGVNRFVRPDGSSVIAIPTSLDHSQAGNEQIIIGKQPGGVSSYSCKSLSLPLPVIVTENDKMVKVTGGSLAGDSIDCRVYADGSCHSTLFGYGETVDKTVSTLKQKGHGERSYHDDSLSLSANDHHFKLDLPKYRLKLEVFSDPQSPENSKVKFLGREHSIDKDKPVQENGKATYPFLDSRVKLAFDRNGDISVRVTNRDGKGYHQVEIAKDNKRFIYTHVR